MPVDVAWVGREQATAARFLLADVPGRCLIRCQANDSGRPVWLEIDLPVVLACLERMLGGSLGAGDSAQRPLTELEQRLTGKLAEHCLAVLRDSWPGTVSWAWTATALELAPRQMPQDPRLPLAVAEFRIGLGAVSGRIALALPWSLLASAAGASSGAAAGGTATVSVVVWRSCAEPGPLSELEVGDLIATDQRPGDPLEVNVDGRPRYRGTPGAVDGHKAVRIE
jgi:flagellar motor switch protein FliM